MSKLNQFVSFSVVIAIVFLAIVLNGEVQNLSNQNKNLESKIDKLTFEVKNLSPSMTQVVENENVDKEDTEPVKKVLGISNIKTTPIPTSTPTPTPQVTPTPFVKIKKVANVQNNTVPNPTPTLTPTPTPTPIVPKVSIDIENQGSYQVELTDNDTAFSVLLRAGNENGFNVEYTNYEGMGAFVDCIGGVCAHDNYFWAFYYSNVSSMVGASAQSVSDGDVTSWKFETW